MPTATVTLRMGWAPFVTVRDWRLVPGHQSGECDRVFGVRPKRQETDAKMDSPFEYKFQASGTFDPSDVVSACVENGHHMLLLDSNELPRAFFDLSSGVTGDLVRRLTLYDIRMAVVIADPAVHSRPFQDFAREANRGTPFQFVRTREEAVAWLAGA